MGYSTVQHKVVSEIFEDEAVVVNLEAGTYYSFRGSAPEVWKMTGAGCNRQQILTVAEDPQATSAFLEFLESEGLIVPDDLAPCNLPQPERLSGHPEYTKYDDMKDLLILDPIHEVDQRGWPHKKN
jgi:hypothetical protein